jgi:hypothetical protein
MLGTGREKPTTWITYLGDGDRWYYELRGEPGVLSKGGPFDSEANAVNAGEAASLARGGPARIEPAARK